MSDNEVFDQTRSFADLGLRDSVLKGIEAAGFQKPTPIQAQLIPEVLKGDDLIGRAKTGTGKTAAFGLPILHMADPNVPMGALILVPTRELAAQVSAELEMLGKFTPIRTTCIIGGESMREQTRSIKKGGHIMVGTPGRLMDMHDRREICFDALRYIVLDEVDRMLDIGFREDIRKILGSVKHDHQTVFVSATLDEEIERLARRYMKPNARKIETTGQVLTVSLVEQRYFAVEPWDKQAMLLHLLRHEKPDTTVIFCRTKMTVNRLTKYLQRKGIEASEIHGDLHQKKRAKVMDTMRSGKLSVLVASDLAARGLDIEHISHVINYDLPEDPEIYIHRVGRTARAGRKGHAWSFVTPEQGMLLTAIEKLAGVMIEKMDYPDFKPGPVPADIAERRAASPQRATTTVQEVLTERVAKVEVDGLTEEQKKAMFPNGIVPQSAPKRNLGGRFRTRR